MLALLNEVVAQGYPRDAGVAVLIDIATAPDFDTAAPDPQTASAPHPDYERSPDLVVVNNQVVTPLHPPGERDEADFIRPEDWFSSNP